MCFKIGFAKEMISLLAHEVWWELKRKKTHTNLEELRWLAVDSCETIDGYTLVKEDVCSITRHNDQLVSLTRPHEAFWRGNRSHADVWLYMTTVISAFQISN